MKKLTHIFISVLLFLIPSYVVFAADATGAATSVKERQIEDLKERLATKAAELSQSQRSAIAGPVKSVSITSFTVETKTKDMKIELTDDIKVIQFIKGRRTVLKIDDIAKGDNVIVFGEYDSTIDLIKAHVVFIDSSHETRITGTITEIDKTNYTVSVKGNRNVTTIVDIEKTTKAYNFIIKTGIEKGGFSKLVVGSIVTVTGSLDPKEANRLSASRIIQAMTQEEKDTQTATPSATVKPTSKDIIPTQEP